MRAGSTFLCPKQKELCATVSGFGAVARLVVRVELGIDSCKSGGSTETLAAPGSHGSQLPPSLIILGLNVYACPCSGCLSPYGSPDERNVLVFLQDRPVSRAGVPPLPHMRLPAPRGRGPARPSHAPLSGPHVSRGGLLPPGRQLPVGAQRARDQFPPAHLPHPHVPAGILCEPVLPECAPGVGLEAAEHDLLVDRAGPRGAGGEDLRHPNGGQPGRPARGCPSSRAAGCGSGTVPVAVLQRGRGACPAAGHRDLPCGALAAGYEPGVLPTAPGRCPPWHGTAAAGAYQLLDPGGASGPLTPLALDPSRRLRHRSPALRPQARPPGRRACPVRMQSGLPRRPG